MSWMRVSLLSVVVGAMGCGPGTAAKAVRGDAPTAGAAAGGKCGDEPAPWVIDLPDERANQLETEVKKGNIVLVKYDCQELKVVRGCDVTNGATYAYTGLAYEPKHKELEDVDDAQIALSGGAAVAAKFGAEYKNGAMLRIDYVAVGRQLTATEVVTRNMLSGPKCDEATHFVGAMDVGAFTLSSGAAADISAAADAFGRGGSASSTSKVVSKARGGNPSACKKAGPDDPSPPNDCRSPLLVQLFPIEQGSSTSPTPVQASRPPGPKSGPYATPCPPGRVMDASGSCRDKSKGKAYTCSGNNSNECSAQCAGGSPQSCAILGYLYEKGEGVNADEKKAYSFYKKACDAKDIDGCTGLGYMMSKSDNLDEQRQSVSFLRQACDAGNGRACSGLGQQARLRRDWATASKEFDRGCRLNYSRGCYYAGFALVRLDKEPERALWNFERACKGGDERGCLAAGSFLVQGTAGRKDPNEGNKLISRGLNALQNECSERKSESCEVIGDYYNGRYGKASPQAAKALEFYDKACAEGQADACFEAGLIYEGGVGGVKKDAGKAKGAFERACAKGYDDACKKSSKTPPKPPR